MYPKAPHPARSMGRDEFLSHARERIKFYISHPCTALNPKATPGLPLGPTLGVNTNLQLCEAHGQFLLEFTMARLEKFVTYSADEVCELNAVELVKQNFADPVDMMIKNEPHNKKKMASKRYRLIWRISISDQLIERVLYETQDQKEIDNFGTSPSACGLSLHPDAHEAVFKYIRAGDPDAFGTDVSFWDWLMRYSELLWDLERRRRLGDIPKDSYLWNAMRIQAYVASLSVLVFSDGEYWAQTKPGIMKSGRKITSSTNSAVRVGCGLKAGREWVVAMGDDAVEGPAIPNAKDSYARIGKLLKFEQGNEIHPIEFCSQLWYNDRHVPLTPAKTFYRFLCQPPCQRSPELFAQLAFVLNSHPMWPTMCDMIRTLGWGSDVGVDIPVFHKAATVRKLSPTSQWSVKNTCNKFMSKSRAKEAKIIQSTRSELESLKRELKAMKRANPANQVGPVSRPMKNKPSENSDKAQYRRLKSMITPAKLVDPYVRAWLKLVRRPFSAPTMVSYGGLSREIKVPMTTELIPCNSIRVRNYGKVEIAGGPELEYCKFTLLPDGSNTIKEFSEGPSDFCLFPIGSATAMYTIGVNVDTDSSLTGVGNPGGLAAIGYYLRGDEDWGHIRAWDDSKTTTTANFNPLTYDSLSIPVKLGAREFANTFQARVIAVGIRFTYTGDLANCSGWVECFQGFDLPSTHQPLDSMRQGPGYSRRFFGDQRSHDFWYYPNCDTPKWKGGSGTVLSPHYECGSRLYFQTHLAETNDTVMVEWLTYYEYQGETLITTSTPGYRTPQGAELGNAITSAFHSGDKNIETHVAHHIEASDPNLTKTSGIVETGLEMLEGAAVGTLHRLGKDALEIYSKL